MGSKLKTYDKEFKQKAIKLALSSSQPISHTAKELGVKESTLYSWAHNNKTTCIEQDGDGGKELLSELAKLRKENAHLKEEREILKKAAVCAP
jgi:transposase